MGLKTKISAGLKQAMKDKNATRLCTLRLVSAAIKDTEIAKRGTEDAEQPDLSDAEVLAILAKMVRQRHESARAYEEAGRLELADQERDEIAVLEEFLPRQLSEAERGAAIDKAITETGANSIRDMGRVMGALKARYSGQMDFGVAGPEVRARLG